MVNSSYNYDDNLFYDQGVIDDESPPLLQSTLLLAQDIDYPSVVSRIAIRATFCTAGVCLVTLGGLGVFCEKETEIGISQDSRLAISSTCNNSVLELFGSNLIIPAVTMSSGFTMIAGSIFSGKLASILKYCNNGIDRLCCEV
ncbi:MULTISPECIES: hypothetical protein [Candidatus Ichthyocystis]|uniref:Putative membrane protein n=1 Tax=Candidatus Ichthyocystis hellenicum TaxID=1561003 RepID=A0A0S4M590_9BURK|nr:MULTISPECIES: hypothetical protein [Ichthyocystis]CUT17882.1 putative membrane protein [Candidatus Ichthyocystis hellenicum]